MRQCARHVTCMIEARNYHPFASIIQIGPKSESCLATGDTDLEHE